MSSVHEAGLFGTSFLPVSGIGIYFQFGPTKFYLEAMYHRGMEERLYHYENTPMQYTAISQGS